MLLFGFVVGSTDYMAPCLPSIDGLIARRWA